MWINGVPTEDSMGVWFTYSTSDANKDHVVQTNISIGPMYANMVLRTACRGEPTVVLQ